MVYVLIGIGSEGECDGRKGNDVREICNRLDYCKHYVRRRGRTLFVTITTLRVMLTKNWEVYGGRTWNGKLNTDYAVMFPAWQSIARHFPTFLHASRGPSRKIQHRTPTILCNELIERSNRGDLDMVLTRFRPSRRTDTEIGCH